MVWFALGLMIGGFLGMLLMAIFASNHKVDEVSDYTENRI